jgi:hypothetical protein
LHTDRTKASYTYISSQKSAGIQGTHHTSCHTQLRCIQGTHHTPCHTQLQCILIKGERISLKVFLSFDLKFPSLLRYIRSPGNSHTSVVFYATQRILHSSGVARNLLSGVLETALPVPCVCVIQCRHIRLVSVNVKSCCLPDPSQ